jgi:hypothetical protein
VTDYDAAVDSFASEAHAYCEWFEKPNDWMPLVMVQRVASLYCSALRLPDVDAEFLPDGIDTPTLPTAELERLRSSLPGLPFQYYWELFHSVTDEADEPVCGDLAEDLLEIYKDVKEGLLAFEAGERILAVWHWRNTFGIHWGRHATSAIKALHDFEPPDE